MFLFPCKVKAASFTCDHGYSSILSTPYKAYDFSTTSVILKITSIIIVCLCIDVSSLSGTYFSRNSHRNSTGHLVWAVIEQFCNIRVYCGGALSTDISSVWGCHCSLIASYKPILYSCIPCHLVQIFLSFSHRQYRVHGTYICEMMGAVCFGKRLASAPSSELWQSRKDVDILRKTKENNDKECIHL